MRNSYLSILFLLLVMVSCKQSQQQSAQDEKPVLMLRMSINNTITDEAWAKMLSSIKKYPECCDEVWFSSGTGIIPLEKHHEHAKRLLKAKEDLKELGIGYSIQIQMTLGHGDQLGIADQWTAKTWTGWTGSTGVEAKYCNCPLQPAFLEYMRKMTRIYAEVKPAVLWIDDDLRYDNHYPATEGSKIGCWCATCIEAFSASENYKWTRETLDKAMNTDKELAERWKSFSLNSLKQVARLIAEEVRAVSPEVKMGYQKTFFTRDTLVVKTILKELADVSGKKVAYRPGGAAYYDKFHPAEQIKKSMDAARFMHLIGCPDYVDVWCPEIESYPRHYGSRSGQSVLLEGFAGLAYGMNSVSMYVTDRGQESPELKASSMLRPIAEGSATLREYARANKGTTVVGFRANENNTTLFEFGIKGVPVLPGVGISLGTLSKNELYAVNIYGQPSSAIQAFRDEMNKKSAAPVLCKSPFVGLVIPRVDASGELRTLGVMNCRIDVQGPIRFELSSLPQDTDRAVWYELKKEPVTLNIQRQDGVAFIEIPEIAAWNAGFLKF